MMIRTVALCICLAATLTLAAAARGGGDDEADRLAHAVLTAPDRIVENLADEIKGLSHEKLLAVLESIRREYRALADSKGGTTKLAVVGTYGVDRQSVYEEVLAHGRAGMIRGEKLRPPTPERLAEIETLAAAGAKAIVDGRFAKGNPMVLYMLADGTFEVDERIWKGRNIRRGTWTLKGGKVEFKIKWRDDNALDEGLKFSAKILNWGRLAVSRAAFGFYSRETWVMARR